MIRLRDLARRPLALSADKDPTIALLDFPDVERIEGGSADRFAGAQIEAGVMPWTTHGAVNDKPVDKRSVIVAAVRIYRKNLGTFTDQQNLPITDMAHQLAVLEKAGINTLRQVRSCRLSLLLSHLFDPPWLRGLRTLQPMPTNRDPGSR
jgi:hypothetical protein